MRRAFITGVSGQDGSYLSELLLGEGVEVYGLVRRKADSTNWRIRHLLADGCFHLVHGDILDPPALVKLLGDIRPQFVFNLAAQSFVPFSWEAPVATAQVTACGVLNVLEAIRLVDPGMRFYQASSSEIFGAVRESPQTENTPPHPRSPYGVSKTFGHWITVNYRESHGMFACSGMLFNHESERPASISCRARSPTPQRRLGRASAPRWLSATWTPPVTGATPPTTSARCG